MKLSDLKIPYLLVIALSLIALAPMPYGYYKLLKILVMGCATLTAYLKHQGHDKGFMFWLCVFIAILFNPIIPIHLNREVWMILNVVTAISFCFLWFKVLNEDESNEKN